MRRRESRPSMRQILRLREIKFIFLRYHRAEECESGMNMRRDSTFCRRKMCRSQLHEIIDNCRKSLLGLR